MTEPSPVSRFAAEVCGFPLHPEQAAIVDEIYRDGIRVAILRCGRRAGKGRLASIVATWEAVVGAERHLRQVPAGERIAVVIVAVSQRQAGIIHRYVKSYFTRPELAPLVVRETESELDLTNGVTVLTLACSAPTVRGLATPVVILDECAWFQGRDGSPLDVAEVWNALVPGSASFPAARILALSTPRWSLGWFYEMCRLAESGEHADMRTWHRTTAQMNPSISASFLAAEREKDEAAFLREYGAAWDSGVGALFDSEFVRASVREAGELPWRDDAGRYVIACDAAATGDTFSVLVGHRERDGTIVVDRVQGWRGSKAQPVQMDLALDQISDLAAAYHGCDVLIDQWSSEVIRQSLTKRGVHVQARPWTSESKTGAATALRRVLYANRLSIPQHAGLIGELSSLEQHPMPTGRVRISAPPGSHDDYAMATLALVDELERDAMLTTSTSYLPSSEEPIVRRGDLVLRGSRFVDRETPHPLSELPDTWSK